MPDRLFGMDTDTSTTSTKSDEQHFRIYPIAVVLGAFVGGVASAFVWGVVSLKNLIWSHKDWSYNPKVVFLICLVGGLLVGLLNHFSNLKESHAHDLNEVFDEVQQIESVPLPKASQIFRRGILGITSLGFGGPLGPEAPVIELVSQFSARMAHILRIARFEAVRISVAGALGSLFGAPLALATDEVSAQQPSQSKVKKLVLLGPEIIAGVTAFVIFKKLLPGGGFHTFTGEENQSQVLISWNILWVVVISVLVGAVVRIVQHVLPIVRQFTVQYLPGGAISAGLISGVVLGIGGATNKLVLFSGHHEIQELLDEHYLWKFLIGIMLLKIVVLLACLAGGWFGGQIFPISFIGVALALSIGNVVGTSDTLMFAGAGFVAAVTVSLRKPMLGLILGILFFPSTTWLALALATAIATIYLNRIDIKSQELH